MNDVIRAAGAVVWRPAADDDPGAHGAEILLVHRPKYDDWSLPKGKREPGEHVLLTAVREILEETSVRPVLGPRLPTSEYQVGDRSKQTDYWSAVGLGQAAASHEVDAVAWLPLPQAAKQLSYAGDAALVAGFRPRPTAPLILLRHASAGQKGNWPADDEARPLDAKGVTDALVLARLLACFAPRARVLSSPARRCIESVRPYAESFGGAVEVQAALTISGRPSNFPSSRTSAGDTLQHLVRDLAQAGRPAVMCLHRENLPKAVAAACSVLSARSPEPPDPSLPKGGFWVVHTAAGELAALERYELS